MTPTPSPPAEAEAVVRRLMSFIIDEGEWGGPSINLSDLHVSDFVDAIATIRTLTTAREQAETEIKGTQESLNEMVQELQAICHKHGALGGDRRTTFIAEKLDELVAAREQAERERDEARLAEDLWGWIAGLDAGNVTKEAVRKAKAAEARATALEEGMCCLVQAIDNDTGAEPSKSMFDRALDNARDLIADPDALAPQEPK